MLSFASSPNYESPTDSGGDNVYEVTVVARDDASNSGTLDVVVTVTDQNEGPEISGQQSLSFTENQTTERVLATYTATDPEDPSALITRWSLTGTDAGDFTINENGELTFRNTPDYERPADSNRDNIYTFSVRAYDGRYYGYHEVTVTVTDENEPPAINTVSNPAFTYRENDTKAVYTFRATDPEGGDITWTPGGADGGDFIIEEGALKFASPPDFESPRGASENEYQVTVQASDGQVAPATLAVTVTVTDVNEGPEVTGDQSMSSTENRSTDQVLARYTGRDPESPGTPINRWSTSGTDGGDFTINENGELTFRNTPDYERPADSNRDNIYTFSVRAYDGRYYGYHEVTVTVEDVNEAPTITTTSKTAFSYRENGTATIYTFKATDPERSAIAWSVSGSGRRLLRHQRDGRALLRQLSELREPHRLGRGQRLRGDGGGQGRRLQLRHAGRGRHRDRPERGAGDIGAAEPIVYREPDYGAGAGHLHGHRPRGPVCPHNALEPDRYRRGRLHHQ